MLVSCVLRRVQPLRLMGRSVVLAQAVAWASLPVLVLAQDAPKPAPSFWDQLKEGVSKGVEQATGGDVVGKISNDVKNNLEGKTPQRMGYVNLGNGQFLTYFEGDARCCSIAGQPRTVKPAPCAPLSKVPVLVTVPTNVRNGKSFEGALVANNYDEMKKQGFLSTFATSGSGTGGNTDITPMRAPTVAVQEATDPDGNTVRNHPNNCRIIVVYDAAGNALRQHSLRSDLDFNMAGICHDKTFAMQRKGIHDASSSAGK